MAVTICYQLRSILKYITFNTLLLSILAGCQTLGGGNQIAVGPTVGPGAEPQAVNPYPYDSSIFLDVAVPVFNPGIPEDFDELEDKSIWPQLRRAEANRFAVQTRDAISKTGAFGSVSVTPTASATAEVYVLGTIVESNSEDVEIKINLVDISGKSWGSETFEHRVSEGFYRDKQNDGKDSYQAIFDDIASYVYRQLLRRSEQEKARLKDIATLRFAQSYVPGAFERHLGKDWRGHYQVNSLPSSQDPMMRRIEAIRVQDQLFIDRLQSQYDGFSTKTDESYLIWQEETLPEVVAAREARSSANIKTALGIAALIAAGIGIANADSNSDIQDVLTGVAGIGGAILIGNSFGDRAESRVHRATIDELGEALDIEMDPNVMELQDKTVELNGTAQEQYEQWQAHLRKIHALEQVPDQQI